MARSPVRRRRFGAGCRSVMRPALAASLPGTSWPTMPAAARHGQQARQVDAGVEAHRMRHVDGVLAADVAGGAGRVQPSAQPPSEPSKRVTPSCAEASTLARPMPRVLWKMQRELQRAKCRCRARVSATCAGAPCRWCRRSSARTPRSAKRSAQFSTVSAAPRLPSGSRSGGQRHVHRHAPGQPAPRPGATRRNWLRATCAGWPGCASPRSTSPGSVRRRAIRHAAPRTLGTSTVVSTPGTRRIHPPRRRLAAWEWPWVT